MHFKKLRLLRELKERHTERITENAPILGNFSDEELLDVLIALDLDSKITDTINNLIDTEYDVTHIYMVMNVLSSSIGRTLRYLQKERDIHVDDLFNDCVSKIEQNWRKHDG